MWPRRQILETHFGYHLAKKSNFRMDGQVVFKSVKKCFTFLFVFMCFQCKDAKVGGVISWKHMYESLEVRILHSKNDNKKCASG